MRRGPSDSTIINNFFSLATIIIVSVTLVIYKTFILKDEEEIKYEKLQCEKQHYTFSKVFNQKLLDKSINALNKGYYRVEGSYLKSEHMKSSIENIVSLDEVNGFYQNSIAVGPKKDIEKYLNIRYELIENDKKDPNKKEEECKLNAGSVMTSFRINSKEIFRVYTDFNFMYKNAIKERIDCSIKVFKNHVQNSPK